MTFSGVRFDVEFWITTRQDCIWLSNLELYAAFNQKKQK